MATPPSKETLFSFLKFLRRSLAKKPFLTSDIPVPYAAAKKPHLLHTLTSQKFASIGDSLQIVSFFMKLSDLIIGARYECQDGGRTVSVATVVEVDEDANPVEVKVHWVNAGEYFSQS